MDYYCYFKRFYNFYIIFLLYIDDMLVVASNIKKVNKLKQQLSKGFEMKDLE